MLWIHPAIQLLAMFFAFHALRLGWKRFCTAHLGQKCVFPWKEHVQWGQLAEGFWLGGLALGLWAAHWTWRGFGITGAHFWIGLAMGALIVVSFASGTVMNRIKKRRRLLPLVHACAGFALAALALAELVTGILVLGGPVLGLPLF
ncbi:MAG: DUF4079 family protein [Desulfovibrio sp.]